MFFFWSGLLSAFSFPIAARLSRRLGLVNTMVFTHIPSSLFLIAASFAPALWLALAFLLLRAALSQMDVPTRTSYVMAVVTPVDTVSALDAVVMSVPVRLNADTVIWLMLTAMVSLAVTPEPTLKSKLVAAVPLVPTATVPRSPNVNEAALSSVVNAVVTLNLLVAARDFCRDTPFCFISTNKVYGAIHLFGPSAAVAGWVPVLGRSAAPG